MAKKSKGVNMDSQMQVLGVEFIVSMLAICFACFIAGFLVGKFMYENTGDGK